MDKWIDNVIKLMVESKWWVVFRLVLCQALLHM